MALYLSLNFVGTWEEKWGIHQPTASEQVYAVLSPLKGHISYLGRQIAFYEKQLQIIL